MNRKVEIMFDKENRQREAKKRLKEKQLALVNGSKKMVVVGATTLVLAGAFSCSQASAYDRYDDNSYRGLGYMCFSDEVGSDGDGSYVSPGTGDYGGISYGLYQFSTTTGSAKDFVNWSKDNNYPEIYKIFQDAGNPKAGTPAFGKAWKKCYRELEGKFEEAQTEFAMGELINPGYEKVKKETGIDLKKSRARTEFLISTANQFGRGGIVTLFKEVQNKGIKLSDDMSDTELLGIMCQHKYDTVDYHFRSSSSAVQRSARLRFKREKKELLKIAKEEEGPKLDEIDTNKEQTEATKTETSSSKTSKKEVVNDTADKYQGKGITYDFGEKNYKSGSLDCSGLISQMMNDMGVKVDAGNTNALKFSNDSKKISKDEVQPGDLVFWNDDNGSRHNSVYHIGMYVGNDTIVDCSPSHNGVGTRKLSQCKDTGDMHYTYGRYTKLENKMKDYAQKIVESIDEFDDVITVDDSDIEKDYKEVEEKTTELKEAINENAKEDKSEESSKEDNNQKEESSKEDKSEETSKEDREDNNVQEENKKDNETSLDKSEDASNKDEFESIIDEDKTDKSEEENNQKEESSKEDKEEETSNESNESFKEDKTEESSEDKEETNDSTLDKTLVVGDSHAKALEDKLKDNKDTEVEATVGASAYVYLNDTNYFGDKLIDKLPKDSDKINKVIISLGVNNIEGNSNINDVKKVIDKIESMYPGKDIYFMKVNHVGDKYKDGDVDKTNKMIDDLNKEIENYVKDKDKVKVIDASKGLETEGKLTETSDGLHVKDNDKLIDNLEKGIEENKKDNETSLDKSEDASNKDEFESIIDEDKTDKSEETSKEEDKSNENNQKEESSKEDKSEETSKEDKEEDSSNKEESAVEKEETSKEENNQKEETTVDKQEETTESSNKEEPVEKEETSKEDNNVQEENNQKEKTIESSKEDKSEESSKEEDVVEKEESSKEDNNVQEENNQKEETTVDKQEETTESSNKEESAVEKEESSNEDKSEESSKEYNNVQESTKETSNEDKEENVVKEQKETSKEEDKSEVKQTVQDKSNESSKEEKPVVEEQKSVNDNQESTTETSKEDNSESQKENSRVDELHSRLQNNLFGRILMS